MKSVVVVALLACVLAGTGCGKSRKEREEEAQQQEQQQRDLAAKQARADEERRQAALRAVKDAEAEKERQADAELIAKFESYVANGLKDPQSAQFADVHLNAAKDALCGRVNAKNGFGGYVGFVNFVATESGPVRGVNAYLASDSDVVGLLYTDLAKRKGCAD